MDAHPTLENPDDDPRLWLEGIDDSRATAWVDRETRRTLADFADAAFERDRDAVVAIFDRDDRLPLANRRGGLFYNV